MNTPVREPSDRKPIESELREQLFAPFVEALATALREAAQTDAFVRDEYQTRTTRPSGELLGILDLASACVERVVLGAAAPTATALATRMLAEAQAAPDDALVRDCLGELVNVTAGQAKALLHGTTHQLSFTTPTVRAGAATEGLAPGGGLVGVMATDAGDVLLQLCLKKSTLEMIRQS